MRNVNYKTIYLKQCENHCSIKYYYKRTQSECSTMLPKSNANVFYIILYLLERFIHPYQQPIDDKVGILNNTCIAPWLASSFGEQSEECRPIVNK